MLEINLTYCHINRTKLNNNMNYLKITHILFIPLSEIKITFIGSPGPGGQNVNKVSTSAQLRFNIHTSSLSEEVKMRLLTRLHSKLTINGELIIKASRHRTQNRNKEDAIQRLQVIIQEALILPKKRKKTTHTAASKKRRLDKKTLDSKRKAIRRNKPQDEFYITKR